MSVFCAGFVLQPDALCPEGENSGLRVPAMKTNMM